MVSFKNKKGHNTFLDIKKLSKVFSCTCCSSCNFLKEKHQEKNSICPSFAVTLCQRQTIILISQRMGQSILIILNFFYNIGTLVLIVSYAINFGNWGILFLYFFIILLFHASLLFGHCSIFER